MLATLGFMLLAAGDPAGRLEVSVGKEMTAAIVAINKALGLETWDAHGVKPCVDRGGLEATAKDVPAEEARQCASTALANYFPGLGENYVVGIPMADIGPVTVFAIGLADADGWGAYSCDPTRKCAPTKLSATSKQAKRLADRYRRACLDAKTIWFPNRDSVCEGVPVTPATDPAPEPAKAPIFPAGAKPAPTEPRAPSPWPVKG